MLRTAAEPGVTCYINQALRKGTDPRPCLRATARLGTPSVSVRRNRESTCVDPVPPVRPSQLDDVTLIVRRCDAGATGRGKGLEQLDSGRYNEKARRGWQQ